MMVRVKLFAAAREAAGCEVVEVQAPDGATVADLRRLLAATCPSLKSWTPHLLFAVDCQYVGDASRIDAAAEVAAFPPVSGG